MLSYLSSWISLSPFGLLKVFFRFIPGPGVYGSGLKIVEVDYYFSNLTFVAYFIREDGAISDGDLGLRC